MSMKSLITDPETIRSNQNGQLTKEQYGYLKTKFSSLPGWFTIGLMAVLLLLVTFLAGKTLARSTPLAMVALVGVILATVVLTSFLGGLVARPRMSNISVVKVPGQIIWNNNQYTAVTAGRTLEPITDTLNLQPGDYTFYLVHGTNYLLSAQPGGGQTAAPMDLDSFKALLDQPLDFDPKLEPEKAAERLGQLKQGLENLNAAGASSIDRQEAAGLISRMTEQMKLLTQGQSLRNLAQLGRQMEVAPQPKLDDQGLIQLTSALDQVGVRNATTLIVNRGGVQSAGQRFELIKQVGSNLIWFAFLGIGWLVINHFILLRGNWQAVLVAAVILGLSLLVLLSSVREELSDLVSGSVQIEEGQVTKFTRIQNTQRGSYTHYYYQVNQNSLEVSEHAYNALIEGSYRVYFLAKTGKLVNIDPLTA